MSPSNGKEFKGEVRLESGPCELSKGRGLFNEGRELIHHVEDKEEMKKKSCEHDCI